MKREQAREIESQVNTRQDRNTFVTGGGTLTWSASAGSLTWTAPIYIRVGTKAVHTVGGPVVLTGINATHKAVYGLLNRATPGALTLVAVDLGAAVLDSDNAYVIAVRGADDKLYFSNGTVFSDTDAKEFGTLAAATDRDDITANGVALQSLVSFTYVTGSDQLAVYVGGILQQLGVHYVETTSSSVTFQAGFIPSAGEVITFLNVAGGQGPSGTSGLQDSYLVGPTVDATPGTPVQLNTTAGTGTTSVLQAGNAAENGGLAAFQVLRNGNVGLNKQTMRDGGGDNWVTAPESGTADLLIHSDLAASEFGFKLDKGGAGIEFGKMPAGGPWAPQEGGGFLRWVVFEGTLDAGNSEFIGAGLDPTKVIGASISVLAASGNADLLLRNLALADSELYVVLETGTGDIYIAGNTTTYSTTAVGTRYQNKAFKLVVFLSN